MNNRSFAIILLAILITQPLVAISGIGIDFFNGEIGAESNVTLSQEPGTRLGPGQHANHVPVIIDGVSDFEVQGWPGDGTSGSPYIISGLNITHDVSLILVSIVNVDAYFVVRDCYLGQLSLEWAIHLENVSNAVIEFVTINSVGDGINVLNATDFTLSHISMSTENSDGLFVENSNGVEIVSNYFTGYGMDIRDSSAVVIQHNEIFDVGTRGAYILRSNSTLFENNTISQADSNGLELDNSSHCEILYNLVNITGKHGFYLRLSEYTNIWYNTILDVGDTTYENGIDYIATEWISIKWNQINGSYYFPIYAFTSANGEILDNVLVDSPSGAAVALDGSCYNYTVEDNIIDNTWGGVFTFSGNNVNISRNTISNNGQYFIAIQGVPDANVFNNTCWNSNQWGIFSVGAPRTEIAGNILNSTLSTNLYIGHVNYTIHDNFIYDSPMGVDIISAAHNATLTNNLIMMAGYGMRIRADNAFIESNAFIDCSYGVFTEIVEETRILNNYFTDSDTIGIQISGINETVMDNTVRNSGTGIKLGLATTPEIRNNIIASSIIGIESQESDHAIFENNNMTGCGFHFGGDQGVSELNHTFIDNNVNGKPLFYALNQSGLALNGEVYGEIILVNCSDSSIDGGVFTWGTSAIQMYQSNRIDVSNIQVYDQWYGMYLYESVNVSLVDSAFTGRGDSGAFDAWVADGLYIENVTFTNLNEIGIDIMSVNPYTIQDCHFENIAEYGFASYNAVDGLISGCEFINMTIGIEFQLTYDTLVTGSHFMWNEYGLNSEDESDGNNATFNNFHDNMYGIRMDDSYSWFIYNNSIGWNSYGLFITATNNAQVIYNNTFVLNHINNGYDSGADAWDDHVDGGNYWHDYIGTGTYSIPGGSSVDNYPIKFTPDKPIINNPIDIWYAEGSVGNYITWFPYDDSLKNWVADMDGSEWDADAWNYDNITVNVDGLPYGTHTIVIHVWDVDNNYVNDTVLVHVYDDILPEIDGPPNQWLFVDATGQTLEWEVSDKNPGIYNMTVDGVEFATNTWSNGTLAINVDSIAEGEHTVRMTIYDLDGNFVYDTVLVRVIADSEDPTVEGPDDFSYYIGETGNEITWIAEDEYPSRYEVSYNGTTYVDSDWGGSRIVVIVDGLSVGTHTFAITVYDASGNQAQDSVTVTVLQFTPETTPPPPIDYTLLVIVVVIGAAAVVVIVVIILLKKRSS